MFEEIKEFFSETGFTEELSEANFVVPNDEDYVDFGENTEEWDIAEGKPGLWDNIRKKKEREGKNYKPAKPGDKDRPKPDAWKKAQKPKKKSEDAGYKKKKKKEDAGKKKSQVMDAPEPDEDQTPSSAMKKKYSMGDADVFDNPGEAMKRAKELGLDEVHTHKTDDGKTVYMPGKTHEEYMKKTTTKGPHHYKKGYGGHMGYKYEDPQTGEIYMFKRRGVYKKNGRVLVPVSGSKAHKAGPMEDHIFRTKEAAMKFAKRFDDLSNNVHTTKTGDGTVLYIPGKDENEFRKWYRAHKGEDAKGAEYQGRKVTLNKPFRTPDGPKKMSVYVKNEKGNVVKVNFGDPNMEIKRDNPARRKSFRARHQCDTNPGPKWKARYWSCKAW